MLHEPFTLLLAIVPIWRWTGQTDTGHHTESRQAMPRSSRGYVSLSGLTSSRKASSIHVGNDRDNEWALACRLQMSPSFLTWLLAWNIPETGEGPSLP